jgi:WD40 repeat protein
MSGSAAAALFSAAPSGAVIAKPDTGVNLTKEFFVETRGSATAVAWSPDGLRLAAASWYGEDVTVWGLNAEIVGHFKRLGGGPYVATSIAFVDRSAAILFPPGQTSDKSACLEVWNIKSGKIQKALPGPAENNDVARNRTQYFAISDDQKIIAAAPAVGGHIALYDSANWTSIGVIDSPYAVASLAFFKGGNKIAVGALGHGRVLIASTHSPHVVSDYSLYDVPFIQPSIGAIAVSPDGTTFLTGIGLITISGQFDRGRAQVSSLESQSPAVSVWRSDNGSFVRGLPETMAPVRQAVWDPSGRFVALIEKDNLVLWPLNSHDAAVRRFSLPGSASSVAITANGARIAVAHANGVTVFRIG